MQALESTPRSDDGVQSTLSSVATLFQAIVGAGALSLPYAFQQAGAMGAILLCVVVCSCEGFTLYVLSKFAERYDRQSYSQLVRANVGRKMSAALPVLLIIYSFGSCTAFLMVTTDALCGMAQGIVGDTSILADRRVMMLIVSYVVLLPTCLARTLGALVLVSSSAFFAFLYTAAVIVYEGYKGFKSREPHPSEGFAWFKWDISALYALPIIVFGFNSHTNIITIFKELKDQPDSLFRRTSVSMGRTIKMENMLEVIFLGLSLILSGYLVVGLSGYMGYLDNVSSNILNDLPATTLVQIARAAMAFIVMFTIPMTLFPAREACQDAMAMVEMESAGQTEFFNVAFTFTFISGITAIAMVVKDLGIVLSLVGGTVASFLIFFVPGLMLINESIRKHSKRLLTQHASSELLAEFDSDSDAPTADVARPTFSQTSLSAPLLERLSVVADKGIKKSGLMYSPGKSWVTGVFLISLSIIISAVTVFTTVFQAVA